MLTYAEIQKINELLGEMDECIDQAKAGLWAIRNVVSYAIVNTPGVDLENCKAIEFVCDNTEQFMDKKLTELIDQVWVILNPREEPGDATPAAIRDCLFPPDTL